MDATTETTRPFRYSLTPSIRVTFTDDGATVLDTRTGRIITTNRTAGELLRAIQGGATYETLFGILDGLTEAPAADVVDTELRTFLQGLIDSRLIAETSL
jgi:hypothetical protein